MLNLCGIVAAILKMATDRLKLFNVGNQFGTSLSTHISNFDEIEPMLNFCGIVATILKMAISRNLLLSGINSGHHYLLTYQILMISDNVEFLLSIFYAVFWQPFSKWQTSRKFRTCRIAPLMVIYHYVKFYVSIIIHLEVININVRNFNFPIGFYSNPHPL